MEFVIHGYKRSRAVKFFESIARRTRTKKVAKFTGLSVASAQLLVNSELFDDVYYSEKVKPILEKVIESFSCDQNIKLFEKVLSNNLCKSCMEQIEAGD